MREKLGTAVNWLLTGGLWGYFFTDPEGVALLAAILASIATIVISIFTAIHLRTKHCNAKIDQKRKEFELKEEALKYEMLLEERKMKKELRYKNLKEAKRQHD